jgi:hypothetical protein
MNEEELNEELELPKTLWNIPLKEKIELLRFKRIHNEVGKMYVEPLDLNFNFSTEFRESGKKK